MNMLKMTIAEFVPFEARVGDLFDVRVDDAGVSIRVEDLWSPAVHIDLTAGDLVYWCTNEVDVGSFYVTTPSIIDIASPPFAYKSGVSLGRVFRGDDRIFLLETLGGDVAGGPNGPWWAPLLVAPGIWTKGPAERA